QGKMFRDILVRFAIDLEKKSQVRQGLLRSSHTQRYGGNYPSSNHPFCWNRCNLCFRMSMDN
ncbi:hypothetical protein FS842_010154, partial [Serendipita sp. 407]